MSNNADWLKNRYKTYDIMIGNKIANRPKLIEFKCISESCEMLHRHIEYAKSTDNINMYFLIHADVDVDGVASAYIVNRFLCQQLAKSKVATCINKEKEHGINEKHVKVFNESKNTKLVIIVDSSSKCQDYIKELECDVLVLDHHNIGDSEITGNTRNGKYVIINNTSENDSSIADMSGAEVVYEFLRYYQNKYFINGLDVLEAERLYQWVAMSLFTDVIDTDNERNQWYLQRAFDIKVKFEDNLGIMCSELSKWQKALDKSFISFKFASIINSAIRAGASDEVINIVFEHPKNINNLLKYKDIQNKIVESNISYLNYSTFCMADISETGIGKAYCGLIATKILEETKKSTIVYRIIEENGIYKASGSFRGVNKQIKYQEMISCLDGCRAEGHSGSFGFAIPLDMLTNVMSYVTQYDVKQVSELVTLGNIAGIPIGEHHYNNANELMDGGLLYKIGVINSLVASNAAINIVCMNDSNVELCTEMGKLFEYKVHGIECKAFERLNAQYIEIYAEKRNNLELFARNKNM